MPHYLTVIHNIRKVLSTKQWCFVGIPNRFFYLIHSFFSYISVWRRTISWRTACPLGLFPTWDCAIEFEIHVRYLLFICSTLHLLFIGLTLVNFIEFFLPTFRLTMYIELCIFKNNYYISNWIPLADCTLKALITSRLRRWYLHHTSDGASKSSY